MLCLSLDSGVKDRPPHIDSDDVLSQLQINQLIAIQSPKSGRYIIAMIVKIYRKATDMTLNDEEDEEDGKEYNGVEKKGERGEDSDGGNG